MGEDDFNILLPMLMKICPNIPEISEKRPFAGIGGQGHSLKAVFLPVGLGGRPIGYASLSYQGVSLY